MKVARVGVIATAILAMAMTARARSQTSRARGHLILPARRPQMVKAVHWARARRQSGHPAGTLTIQRTMGGDTVTLTYQLDGAESRNLLAGGDGRQVDSLSIVKWDGPKLTISPSKNLTASWLRLPRRGPSRAIR